MKKLLISNQYGAWVMALMPFLYGMWLAPFTWQSWFLLAGWIALYLAVYPFLSVFKGRNQEFYKVWTVIYATISFLLFLPAFFYNWEIILFGVATIPFILVNIYYVNARDERAICNDFAGIAIFEIIGAGAYYFTAREFDQNMLHLVVYTTLMLISIVFYVKTMMRERKNKFYLYTSYVVHLAILLYFFSQSWMLGVAFLPAYLRAYFFPKRKLSVQQVGTIEFAISLWFFCWLLAY